ncbi:MAG: peptide ABC transporter substrate-binding protein [Acidobacteriota bacterium]
MNTSPGKKMLRLSSHFSATLTLALLLAMSLFCAGCAASASNSGFFGKTDPPRENVLRYVSGSEPESLDPQVSAGQNEARLYMALYEGLIEYDPKTSAPVPAIAERWEVNKDYSEMTFHLRQNARFSNGDPITAADFVYTIRRGLAPEFASTNAALAFYIKYAQAFNEGGVFVFDPASKTFLLEKDFLPGEEQPATQPALPLSSQPIESIAAEYPPIPEEKSPDADTDFHRFMHSPPRVVLPGDEKKRNKALDADPKLKAAIAGKQLVAVKAEDVGVEAVDNYTLRVSLAQQAPFFISLMPHQFFRVIHRGTVEQFHSSWTDPKHIVTSGPFKLEAWKPYDRIVVVRDPMNWDASKVKLDRIVFYMLVDNTTMLNLYKAGELDAMYNHTVPAAWLEVMGSMKDFMDAPEAAIDYYRFNTTKGPTKDIRVRKALNMSLDKTALANWRHVKPLTAFTPSGIFPGYPQPAGDPFDPEMAKRLLAEAGYADASGKYDPEKFSASEVEMITNPDGNNLTYADFIQAQWKQNLGATIQIRVMESKTFYAAQAKLDYKGISRFGWSADYMDPFTFLGLFYTPTGNNGTGWWDPKFVELLDEANRTVDHQKRYEILAQAEKLMLEAQPIMPITVGTTRWMKKPYVKGMYPNATTLIPWKWVYIERDQSRWDYGVPDMTE